MNKRLLAIWILFVFLMVGFSGCNKTNHKPETIYVNWNGDLEQR
ncbi:MAG: hypothetical protein QCI00_08530 [Candidatus Thermoplasmatota archaeon]|nr:hypothetical protein [Candidatus Thermoplasmatota archaeon]